VLTTSTSTTRQRGRCLAGPLGLALLLALGTARQKAVKAALVDLGVSASRLVTCAPEVDDEPGAVPRVEIGV